MPARPILAAHAPIRVPADLSAQAIIGFSRADQEELWNFPSGGHSVPVRLAPRALVTDANTAVGLAASGAGVTRVLSYQAESALAAGQLVRLLADHEPLPLPVQLVTPETRPFSARLRAFADIAAPAMRATLARIETSATRATEIAN